MTRTNLPKPYLFEIDTPLIVFNGRLIQPKELANADDNYAEFYSKKFSLEEIATPGKLEQLYFRHNRQFFERFKESFARQNMNQEFQSMENITESRKRNKVLSLIVEKVLPVLTSDRLEGRIENILKEEDDKPVVPGAAARQEMPQVDISELPATMVKAITSAKRKLIAKIEKEYEGCGLPNLNVKKTDDIQKKIYGMLSQSQTVRASGEDGFTKLEEDSALAELLEGKNIMMINGKIYSLVTVRNFISGFAEHFDREFYERTQSFPATRNPAEMVDMLEQNKEKINHKYHSRITNKIAGSNVRMNGKYYLPIFWAKTEDLEERYLLMLEKRAKIDSVQHSEYQTRMLYKLEQERKKLEDIAETANYERNNAGFMRSGDDYYVYIITPPYALKSPHLRDSKKYIEFPPAKIAVKIRYLTRGREESEGYRTEEAGGVFEISKPVVINGYKHPFVQAAGNFAAICLGSWVENSYNRLSSLPVEQKVLTLLSQAQKTLMMGYRTGGNPYNPLTRERWDDGRWMTKESVDKKKLVVLNDFGE